MDDADFTPELFQIVRDPRQLKAFTDPIRIRILHTLSDREATNQQLATLLDQPQAKVFYHLRFLADLGLVKQTRTQVTGGNVEKYYRASARIYGIRTGEGPVDSVTVPLFESLVQELAASEMQWPDAGTTWELRQTRLSPERQAEFNQRLLKLLAEFWTSPDGQVDEDPDDPLMTFATVTFRYPGDT